MSQVNAERYAQLVQLVREAVAHTPKCQHQEPIPGLDDMPFGSEERWAAIQRGGKRCERYARFATGTEYPETHAVYCEQHIDSEAQDGEKMPLGANGWLDRALAILEGEPCPK